MRHLLKATHLLVSIFGLMLLTHGAVTVRAQDAARFTDGTARKFDEFEEVGGCDAGARLDNFAIELMNDKSVTGYIICYGPEGEAYGTGEGRRRLTEDYLVNTRGIDSSRFKSVYGGRYKEIGGSATELWIVPAEAEPPEPQAYGNAGKTFNGLFTEINSSDALYGGYEDGGTGPAFGNSPYAGFADVLRQQPEKRGYIVAFNSSSAAPGAWRRAAREVSGALESGHGIGAERIKIIYGGYQKFENASAKVQLWVAPPDAPPVKEVKEPEPRPDKAVQIVSVNNYALSLGNNSQLAFEGFADILKTDEQMRACIIIRIEAQTEEAEKKEGEQAAEEVKEAEQTVEASDDTPKVDLVGLTEKWKADLEEKYGISRSRLIVITVTAADEGASLETWVVPPGAQLPDPNIVAEEQPLAEEEMSEPENYPQ